jgi:hypothetical protein
MIQASVQHRLGVEAARQRLAELFARKQIACDWSPDGAAGEIEKSLPLVGPIRARFVIGDATIEVEVLQAPAFPSPATIQRTIVDELSRVLA